MTDKQKAVQALRFALNMYKHQTTHDVKRDMSYCFFLMAFKNISIITDNAFTREQFKQMIESHLDELISMTADA